MTKFISATCACGASFQREVKRGRPQVWCPTCVAKPFYERTRASVVVNDETFLAADEFGEVVPERVVNENDRLDLVREDITAGMLIINADHKVRFAALVASGLNVYDAAAKAQADTLSASQNLYAELAPKFYKPGREIEDDVQEV